VLGIKTEKRVNQLRKLCEKTLNNRRTRGRGFSTRRENPLLFGHLSTFIILKGNYWNPTSVAGEKEGRPFYGGVLYINTRENDEFSSKVLNLKMHRLQVGCKRSDDFNTIEKN